MRCAIPRAQVTQRDREHVQRARALRLSEMDRDRIDTRFLERVGLACGGAIQARVADQQRKLLLRRRAEVESLCDPTCQRHGRRVLARRVEDERGEEKPFRMLQLRVLDLGEWVGRDDLADPVDEGEPQHLRRIDQERVGPAAVDRLRELGKRPFEHSRRLEEPPGSYVASLEHGEELLGRVVVPAQRGVAPRPDPVEERRAWPYACGDHECGVEREMEHEPRRRRRDEIDNTVRRRATNLLAASARRSRFSRPGWRASG